MTTLMTHVPTIACVVAAVLTVCMPVQAETLPENITQLDWIQGNGAAYIKTAYKPTCTDKIEMKITYVASTRTEALWCSRGSGNASTFTAFIVNGASIRFDRRTSGTAQRQTMTDGAAYTFVADYNTLETSINGVPGTTTMPANDFTPPTVLWLFASHANGTSPGNYAYYKLHYLKAWDKDGNLIHHFVPACKNTLSTDDVKRYGVFDLVDWAYAPNAIAGSTFTPSEEVPQVDNKTVAYWKFDADHPFRDHSGNGNALTYSSDNHTGVVLADGMATFRDDAACSLKTAAGKLANYPTTAITIEAFVRRHRGGGVVEPLPIAGLNHSLLGVAPRSFGITRFGELSAGYYYANNWNTGYVTYKSPMACVDDVAWHHVALTLEIADGAVKSQSYVDGVPSLEEPLTRTTSWTTLFTDYVWFAVGGAKARLDFADVRLSHGVLEPSEFLQAPSLPPSATEDKVVWDSPETVLSAGADVIIPAGASVTLTSSTPRLQSLTVEGSLMFEGWETKVDAEAVVIRNGGLVSAKGPFYGTGTSLSNRVWITCGTLDLAAGGEINVAERGYVGSVPTAYRDALGVPAGTVRLHPGAFVDVVAEGNGLAPSHGGAGCFGYGTDANANRSQLAIYGSAEWPTTPGTGGASNRMGHEPMHAGGQGGGVATIEATGAVTINGRIVADGESLPIWTSSTTALYGCVLPGTGGSVLIDCATISGSGLISANGGDTENDHVNSKCAGGGRIAIHYDTAAQDPAAVAGLIVSAKGGCLRGHRGAEADVDSRMVQHAQAGTIWLSDGSWVAPETINHFHGRLLNVGTLDFTGDVTLGQWFGIGDNGCSLHVRGNLKLSGVGARLDVGAADSYTGWGARYGYQTTIPSQLVVEGDLTITDGARLDVHAAVTNGTIYTEGARVVVGGTLMLGASAKLYPLTSPHDGGSVSITARNIVIDETATVGLAGAGFTAGNNGSGKGPGYGSPTTYGAGYGGLGGCAEIGVTYGQTYGDAARPVWPGSGGGSGWYSHNGSGGGFVHLRATQAMTVNGTICADGVVAGGSTNGGTGGSGGGILLESLSVTLGETARLTANGGAAMSETMKTGKNTSGGGGGRIAIWSGEMLWEPDMKPHRYVVSETIPDGWATCFSVSGGAQMVADAQHFAGTDGTIRFVTTRKPQGLLLIFK